MGGGLNSSPDASLTQLAACFEWLIISSAEPVEAVEAAEEVEASPMEKSAPSASSEKPSGRRNPPGGKSSLILG